MRYRLLSLMSLLPLAACAPKADITYNPQDFINPNKVVLKTQQAKLPTPKVAATFGLGNDPKVVAAYKRFSRSGKFVSVDSEGFKTQAYDGHAHPIVACEPLRLCVVQLERGEHINNIDLGDSAHWLVSTSRIGRPGDGSYQITLKPTLYNIATDMVVTTDKRTYNIGLVSQKGHYTHVLNFYYPEETLSKAVAQLQVAHHQTSHSPVVSDVTQLNVNQINFDYSIKGDTVSWRPTRAFDDGDKTFIQMPPLSQRMDLPVLYLKKGRQTQLVNYRYKKPYYIIDGLFETAYLISGVGRHQAKVIISNQHRR